MLIISLSSISPSRGLCDYAVNMPDSAAGFVSVGEGLTVIAMVSGKSKFVA